MQDFDLRSLESSLSELNSLKLYIELFTTKNTWRLYSKSSVEAWELEKFIKRYMRSHASVPSPITEETLSSAPMHVLRFKAPDSEIEVTGLVYANGLICQSYDKISGVSEYLLLVEERVAEVWGYPSTYTYPAKVFQKMSMSGEAQQSTD